MLFLFDCMKINSSTLQAGFLGIALVAAFSASLPISAQAQQFTTTGQPLKFYLMDTNGAASLYDLFVNVSRSNTITVSTSSKRYDVAATSNSVTSPLGVALRTTNTPVSRVGTPVVTNVFTEVTEEYYGPSESPVYVTNKITNLTAPFAIYLNDGGRIKGTVSRTVKWGYTNFLFQGGATHRGKLGPGGTFYPESSAMYGPMH